MVRLSAPTRRRHAYPATPGIWPRPRRPISPSGHRGTCWVNASLLAPAAVELLVYDDRAGRKKAIREVLPKGCLGQCSHVHFLRNAWGSLPRKADDDCPKGALLASPTSKTRRRRMGLGLPGSQHGKARTQSWSIG